MNKIEAGVSKSMLVLLLFLLLVSPCMAQQILNKDKDSDFHGGYKHRAKPIKINANPLREDQLKPKDSAKKPDTDKRKAQP